MYKNNAKSNCTVTKAKQQTNNRLLYNEITVTLDYYLSGTGICKCCPCAGFGQDQKPYKQSQKSPDTSYSTHNLSFNRK